MCSDLLIQNPNRDIIMEGSCDSENVPEIKSLKDLQTQLHRVFSQSENINVEVIESLMNSYKSNPKDWKKYAKFDQHRYTRNLVDEGNGKFNLMLLCWGEGHGSSIHDHADAHCFMKMLHGSLSEVRFEYPQESHSEDSELNELSRTNLETNQICYINDSIGLHRVENSSHTEPAVSLHLYCPPFNECTMFDQRSGYRTKCEVTFWSKYGQKTGEGKSAYPPPENN